MTTVILHGELATAVGRAEWAFVIQQPREAVAAIEANTGKLYAAINRAHRESAGAVEYAVLVDGVSIGTPKDGELPLEFYTVGVYLRIEIVPVLKGAGGLWQTIIGVVLIIVGVVLAFTVPAIAPYVIGIGLSMTLGGVAQMLTPTPTLGAGPGARSFTNTDELGQAKEDAKSTPSYLFGGAVNTTQTGNPIAICYGGPLIVGSALLSLAITGAKLSDAVIGAQKPAGAADAFFALPVWARLAADPRRAPIFTLQTVRALKTTEAILTGPLFDLPTMFPAEGFSTKNNKPVPVGNSTLARRTLKGFLGSLVRIWKGNPQSITYAEAVDLARMLGGLGLTNLAQATWKQVVLAIGLHYSPEP